MPTSVTTGHCRPSTAAIGASRSVWSSRACAAERRREAEVGGDPPPDAAALALAHADRRRRHAGDRQAGRGGHEQGRRVQLQHRRNYRQRPAEPVRRRASRAVAAVRKNRYELARSLHSTDACFPRIVSLFAMTRSLLDAFWRAVAYCLHPKVILLSLAPLVGRRRRRRAARLLLLGAGGRRGPRLARAVVAARLVLRLARVGRRRRLPERVRAAGDRRPGDSGLRRRFAGAGRLADDAGDGAPGRGCGASRRSSGATAPASLQSLAWSLGCTLVALVALVASLPLWLIPPLVLVVPPLIWGWLTYRVFSFDVLGRACQPRRAAPADGGASLAAVRHGRAHRLPRRRAVAALGDERADPGLRAGPDPGLDLALHAGVRVLGALVRPLPARRAAATCARSRRRPSAPLAAAPSRFALGAARARRAGSPPHELRPPHRRRRDPVREARRQAPAQGDRAARGARPLARLGALRRRRPGADHGRPEGRVRQRRRRVLLRRHRRDARRPHPAVRRGRARRAAGAASRGARPRARADAGRRPRAGQAVRARSRRQPAPAQHGGVPRGRRDHPESVQQDRRLLGAAEARAGCSSCPAFR